MDKVIYRAKHSKDKATIKSDAHNYLSEKAEQKYKRLGGWVTASSALVGTGLFASITKSHDISALGKIGQSTDWLAVSTFAISIITVILSSLNIFLRFSEIAEIHRKTGVNYLGVVQKLESFLNTYDVDLPSAITPKYKEDAIKKLDSINEEALKVDQTAPIIPYYVIKMMRNRHFPEDKHAEEKPKK